MDAAVACRDIVQCVTGVMPGDRACSAFSLRILSPPKRTFSSPPRTRATPCPLSRASEPSMNRSLHTTQFEIGVPGVPNPNHGHGYIGPTQTLIRRAPRQDGGGGARAGRRAAPGQRAQRTPEPGAEVRDRSEDQRLADIARTTAAGLDRPKTGDAAPSAISRHLRQEQKSPVAGFSQCKENAFVERDATLVASWIRQGPRKLRRAIERLGPYQSLALLAVPVCLVEPLKLIAIAVVGEGHWITGMAMMTAAYAVSLLLVERLFVFVKPRLLRLRWFAKLWAWLVVRRYRLVRPFRGVGAR